MNPSTDRIAREAARLLDLGKTAQVNDAIHAAAAALNLSDSPLPSRSLVRRHAQAMSMQSRGEAGHLERRRLIYAIADDLMAGLDFAFPDARILLVGRAAAGHIDGDPHLHLRLHTDRSITEIARELVALDYEEPRFTTADSRHGRLNQVQFHEQSVPITITRCPLAISPGSHTDLFTGRPVASLTLGDLRQSNPSAR